MAEIPSDIASSAAQANYRAREVAQERAARSSGRTQGPNPQSLQVDAAGEVVETDDQDNQVYADAEGTGSQGRPFEEAPNPDAGELDTMSSDAGADDGEAPRLDIQA